MAWPRSSLVGQSTIPTQSCNWGCPVSPTHTSWDGISSLSNCGSFTCNGSDPRSSGTNTALGAIQGCRMLACCGKSRALLLAASSGNPAPAGSSLTGWRAKRCTCSAPKPREKVDLYPAAVALLCDRSTPEMELLSEAAEWKANALCAPSPHCRRAATASPQVQGWFHLFQSLSIALPWLCVLHFESHH